MNKLMKNFMPASSALSRRHFIVGTGAAGLAVGVLGGCAPSAKETPVDYSALPPNPEVNAWVHIHHDDTVTVRIARSEMGQGTATGLAQLVAEELECDWDKVTFDFPTPGESLARDRVYRSMSTGGSQGLRGSHQYVREGGAAHAASKNETSYGKVAEAASKLAPPLEVTLKEPKDWAIIGQPKKRLDTKDKLTGALKYAAEWRCLA